MPPEKSDSEPSAGTCGKEADQLPDYIREQDEVKDFIFWTGDRLKEIAAERLRKFRQEVAVEGFTDVQIDEISACCWFVRATLREPPDAPCCRRIFKALRRVAKLLELRPVPHGIQVTKSGDRIEAVLVHHPLHEEVRPFSLYLVRRFRRAARYERDVFVG